jgi:tetratricopeptide (TPR) repeat protein
MKRHRTDAEARYDASRRLLHDLDEESTLRANPLLAAFASEEHDRLRARVLRAVESLDPGLRPTNASERQRRLYEIIVRCDLQGDAHKTVAAALGISRRQFYLDRRRAFLMLADAVERDASPQTPVATAVDALSMHLDYVEMLHDQGRHDIVWRECLRALRVMRGHPREMELWTVVSEAARFLGNVHQANEAVEQLRRTLETTPHAHMRRASMLRLAISEMLLAWMQGDVSAALARFETVFDACGSERTMHGRDATLFAILLEYGAEICIESGRWDDAAAYVRRAERIIHRSELPYAAARQHRLRGRIAFERDGDARRAAVELRDALQLLHMHRHMPALAKGTVEYGISLAALDAADAWPYVEYGLAVAKEVCGYDDYAVLVASAAPLMIARAGARATLEILDELRARAPLSARAELLTTMAETRARLAHGDFADAAERALTAANTLERLALYPAAARAYTTGADALARLGKGSSAKAVLHASDQIVRSHGERATVADARRIALFLHSKPQ